MKLEPVSLFLCAQYLRSNLFAILLNSDISGYSQEVAVYSD